MSAPQTSPQMLSSPPDAANASMKKTNILLQHELNMIHHDELEDFK